MNGRKKTAFLFFFSLHGSIYIARALMGPLAKDSKFLYLLTTEALNASNRLCNFNQSKASFGPHLVRFVGPIGPHCHLIFGDCV